MSHASRFPVFTLVAFFCSVHLAVAQTPGPPTALAVTVNADNTITLQWTAPNTGGVPTGYIVQIGTTPGGNEVLNEQIGNVTTYTPSTQLAPGTTYFVRVRAFNPSGVSGPSNEVQVTTACSTPTERPTAVTWRMVSATTVQITWVPPAVVAFSAYKVEVGTATGASNTAVVFTGNGRRTFTTINLPVAGTFFARVRGVGSCNEIEGPASEEIQIQAGVASPPSTTIVVNEFNSFLELKNVSTSPQAIGGWRMQTTTGFDQIGVLAAAIRGGVVIPPGCTYLLVHRSDSILVPADEPLAAFVSEGVAVVRPDGLIIDSAGRRNSSDIANPNTPFVEGNPLRARRDTPSVASLARVADTDTNDNAADFVELATATPQNASGCGQLPPGAPQNLTASLSGVAIELSWAAPSSGGAPTSYIVQVGTSSGASNVLNQSIGNQTSYQTPPLAVGTYFVRVFAVNGAGVSSASNEVSVTVPSAGGAPGPPGNLTVLVNGNTVTLSWAAPTTGGAPTQYLLEAGTAPGLANAAVLVLPISPTAISFVGVPNGTFFVRVRALNGNGISPPSNEVTVEVCGVGCTAPPGQVTNLAFQVSGNNVLLTWSGPTSGVAPTGYVVEIGTAPGSSNLGQFATGSTATFVIGTSVPAGAYYVRVRAAVNDVLGAPSNEVLIIVP